MEKVIYNAKVYLERETFAQAVLIKDDRIAMTGTNEEVLAAADSDAVRTNAMGNLLLPGFHDTHMHLSIFGKEAQTIQLDKITSIRDMISHSKKELERLQPGPDDIIYGMGWNQEQFTDEHRFPNRHDLDQISDTNPIIFNRRCFHIMCCNTKALEMAGIAKEAPVLESGQVDTDENGIPTGLIREDAMNLITQTIPPITDEKLEQNLAFACSHALSCGLTTVASHDVNGKNLDQYLRVYKKLYDKGLLLRIRQQSGIEEESDLDEYVSRGLTTGKILIEPYYKMGPLKLFADGSLGSQTAFMRIPYKDAPASAPNLLGIRLVPPTDMASYVSKSSANGLQVVVHAIGDGAIDTVVTCFEAVTAKKENPLRHGVVHCQITDLPLLERMAAHKIHALIQPVFLASDLYIVESRVGRELASTSYAFKTMGLLGIPVSYGTDCPVENMNPFLNLECAITRKDPANPEKEAYFPEECVDIWTAVDSYTVGSAFSDFDEGILGRIKAGYQADLILVDQDIFCIPSDQIKNTNVLFTMVGGEYAYER